MTICAWCQKESPRVPYCSAECASAAAELPELALPESALVLAPAPKPPRRHFHPVGRTLFAYGTALAVLGASYLAAFGFLSMALTAAAPPAAPINAGPAVEPGPPVAPPIAYPSAGWQVAPRVLGAVVELGSRTASYRDRIDPGAARAIALGLALDAALPEIRGCYEEELGRAPGMGGALRARFSTSTDGRAYAVGLSGDELSGALRGCVERAIRGVHLPRTAPYADGGAYDVTYALTFVPGLSSR